MADLPFVRAEIERARKNVARLRRDIAALQKVGHSTKVAETDLRLVLDRVDALIGERNRLKATRPSPMQGKVLGGRSW
jgi:G:T-mismatch repair DNA endonuclease (very short patch repair protein)